MRDNMNIDKLSFIRIGLLILALANQLLAVFGKSPIPIDDDTANLLLSTVFTLVMSLITAWKNNKLKKEPAK